MSDLVKRLRYLDKTTVLGMQRMYPKELGEAADRIEALETENARLREALEWQASQPEAHPFMANRARAALKGDT